MLVLCNDDFSIVEVEGVLLYSDRAQTYLHAVGLVEWEGGLAVTVQAASQLLIHLD